VVQSRPQDFPFIGGRAYREAATFARIKIAEVVSQHFGCWDATAFKALADELKLAAGTVYLTTRAKTGA
jgi:hypothetical protein